MFKRMLKFGCVTCVLGLMISAFLSFYINNINAIKIDKDLEIVYDANYDDKGLVPSYTKDYGVFYLSDVVVPFINIDSSDAAIVNNQIKDIYNELLKSYERGINDSFTFIKYCNYTFDVSNDLLTVKFNYGISNSTSIDDIKHEYNFDLSNGKLIK